MPLKPLVTAGVENLLNTFLYRSPALKSARTRLQGKVLRVDLKGFSTPLVLVFSERQVDVLGAWEGEADCTVITYASVLPKLRDRQQLTTLIRSGELEVQGDIQVVQNFEHPIPAISSRKGSAKSCVVERSSCAITFSASSAMSPKRSLKSGAWLLVH